MTANELVDTYISFFEGQGHKRVPNESLIPKDDTTLFTTAGMQPLLPYLLGKDHPLGKRLVNVQRCLRTDDIGEVGDATHHTFYEMLGNWSLGDYWKEETILWSFEFLAKELNISPKLLAVTVFEGDKDAPQDAESIVIWKKVGIKENRIFTRPKKDNWWGPVGLTGPCGPDTEMFIWTADSEPEGVPNENPAWVEVWNDVFMQYNKTADGEFDVLSQKNVDTGMGLERMLAILQKKQSSYETDIFYDLYKEIKNEIKLEINDVREKRVKIFLDHARSSMFLINDGILPGKNERESILRRLIRAGTEELTILFQDDKHIKAFPWWQKSIKHFEKAYTGRYEFKENILNVVEDELNKYGEVTKSVTNVEFVQTLISPEANLDKQIVESQLARLKPGTNLSNFLNSNSLTSLGSVSAGTVAFEAKSTLGFPIEKTFEIAEQKLGDQFNRDEAEKTLQIWQTEHQKVSRVSAGSKFAGGLADHATQTIKGHTATHLLHQALRDVLGNQVHQTGSNITAERIRFDFFYDRKPTAQELQKVEEIVSERIKENLPVHFEVMTVSEARKHGAIGLFDEKYGEKVKVYFIGDYSKEYCGGPHVEKTGKLKNFQIVKEESLGKTQRRIYAKIT